MEQTQNKFNLVSKKLKRKDFLNKLYTKNFYLSKSPASSFLNKEKNIKKIKTFFKLKKKWRFWRVFKKTFISLKKITFFEKLKFRHNNIRIIWHQLSKIYSSKIKNIINKNILHKKRTDKKFVFFFKTFELRLSTLLLRGRFFHKLINCFNAIKLNLIAINGIIINKINVLVSVLDLIQKRRVKKKKLSSMSSLIRCKRLKWRNYRWKKARFLLWKIRRVSHFNLFWSKKQNNICNYLEINYKIPALIVIKFPFFKELLVLKQPKLITNMIFKKIYFLY